MSDSGIPVENSCGANSIREIISQPQCQADTDEDRHRKERPHCPVSQPSRNVRNNEPHKAKKPRDTDTRGGKQRRRQIIAKKRLLMTFTPKEEATSSPSCKSSSLRLIKTAKMSAANVNGAIVRTCFRVIPENPPIKNAVLSGTVFGNRVMTTSISADSRLDMAIPASTTVVFEACVLMATSKTNAAASQSSNESGKYRAARTTAAGPPQRERQTNLRRH